MILFWTEVDNKARISFANQIILIDLQAIKTPSMFTTES